MSKISEIIKQIRSGPDGLSQMEIERRTGISQSRISRWENGDVAAGADDALKLVDLHTDIMRNRQPAPQHTKPSDPNAMRDGHTRRNETRREATDERREHSEVGFNGLWEPANA